MKLTFNITRMAQILIASCCLASCDYLDVIPPAQPSFDDTMKDQETTLSFLYSCYYAVPRSIPFHYHAFEQSTDEIAVPAAYSNCFSDKWHFRSHFSYLFEWLGR